MTQRISSTTAQRIVDVLGHDFVFVSFEWFEAHGQHRTRYTVKRPNGEKFIHLVGYDNGQIRKIG